MNTPHIAKRSRLDRLLDKSRPSRKEQEETVSLLSEIADPTPDEQRLLAIAKALLDAADKPSSLKPMMTILPDGDIEIWSAEIMPDGEWRKVERVRHRSYNPGDSLKENVLQEFEAMEGMEGTL